MAVSRGKMLGAFTRGPGGRKCQCCQDPETTRWRKAVERREVADEIAGELAESGVPTGRRLSNRTTEG